MKTNHTLQKLPPKYILSEHDVAWFLVDLDIQNYINLNDAIEMLSFEENICRNTFKNKEVSESYTIRRAILRVLIASQTGFCNKEIPISYHIHGKPYVSHNPVYFNLSHSEKNAIYTFSTRQELGVDMEKVIKMPDENNIAQYIMTQDEYSLYQRLQSDEATFFFFKCWTAKEAYLKLLGTGLQLEPRHVLLHFNDGYPMSAESEGFSSASLSYLIAEPLTPFLACLATHNALK